MSPDFAPLRAIGWPHEGAPPAGRWATTIAGHPDARPARVVEQHRSGYIVSEGRGDGFRIESLPEWQRPATAPEARPAVGDWLLISGNAGGKPSAVALLPRHSAIKRAVAGERYAQQVIAANIDTVFIVCGLDGDFNPRRIERYLLLVRGGARPVIVLTKADTDGGRDGPTATAARALATELATRDLSVFAINARQPESTAVLAPWLAAGRTAVLVGSSGAGKSTLTNTLVGHERMQTGTVREKDARGRHTTTHRALIALPSGACLIDTPGMRELKPTGEEDLAETHFADLDALARRCRFRDCRHRQDPGCALRAAATAGTVDAARLAHYLKLHGEIAGAADRRLHRAGDKPGGKPPPRRPHTGGRRR
ncbi:ribosome small subunit-dependent GTPase A [Salinisphaera orenii]|uniref:Small ribosomal subunit biogenesis GTPase RsgA n=1 Tax=Salinisphaera orenii YIM 95161 TaxID=1051139 RepID=A0A423PU88_9GAMM|nr:ribosome small subunit-dependent GTPase A [Salinisphaera halophila]ROO29159.1 GTPase RsgA [Salinisphaera halophila YIM 95161]